MTALDTLREQMEEMLSRYTLAARVPVVSQRDADRYLVAEKRALLVAHRALVVAELAGEPGAKMVEKAVLKGVAVISRGISFGEAVTRVIGAAVPLLTAPLAAKLAQAEAERDAEASQHERLQYIYLAQSDRVASLEAALGILMNRHGTYCPRCDGDRREPHNEDVACTWCAGSGRWARTAQYREFTALREGSV